MITKRIIPCLDVKDGRVVKGVNFAGLQDVSSPVELAEYYTRSGADELVFLNSQSRRVPSVGSASSGPPAMTARYCLMNCGSSALPSARPSCTA